jgi:nucleoside-diphosphate-sugar epimerase
MKILFTGGSSFTGIWFIQELAAAGHEITAVFRKRPEEYTEAVRRERVTLASKCSRPIYDCSFGDARFLALIAEGGWDLLSHHGADVTNYKSPDFNVVAALGNNTSNLSQVLDALGKTGCRRVLLTGSVFEADEGAGSEGLLDVSAYGLSKALTSRVFRYYCTRAGFCLGKFVIPNPFGPYEDSRFTSYVMRSWLKGAEPVCSSPAYVRDNIHVSLLAKVYAQFAAEFPDSNYSQINPSGYIESQGTFTLRLAQEMRPRLGLLCPVKLLKQIDFPEPRVRINTDPPDSDALGWNESTAWDQMATYYRRLNAASNDL